MEKFIKLKKKYYNDRKRNFYRPYKIETSIAVNIGAPFTISTPGPLCPKSGTGFMNHTKRGRHNPIERDTFNYNIWSNIYLAFNIVAKGGGHVPMTPPWSH